MTQTQKLSRRKFLWATAGATLVAACTRGDDDSEAPALEDVETPSPDQYRESPMLAERVSAGDLSPVADRLPREPYVVRSGALLSEDFADFQPGQFSGTLRLKHDSPDWDSDIVYAGMEPIVWAPGGTLLSEGVTFEGNVVAGFEANADDTVFTFHMREGMRWSDGELLTTEDVRFAFEDVLYSDELGGFVWQDPLRAGWRPDAALAQLEVIDELTFSLTFDAPYGSFPMRLGVTGYGDIIKPRHYLEQFHAKYASAGQLASLLDEEGFEEEQWAQLFGIKQMNSVQNISSRSTLGHPTLTPWVMVDASTDVIRYERNPYYFKIDEAGNQLPYYDELRGQVVGDAEAIISRGLFGEFDYPGAEKMSLRHLPLIAEKADAGEVVLSAPRYRLAPISFELNLTHPDEVWRQVVGDVRFRRALSLAVDRRDILETFFLGEFGVIAEQMNPADHDPNEANRLLDEMGLDSRNSEGLRLGPDGEVFTVPLEVVQFSEDHIPVSELIVDYWTNVGIRMTLRPVDEGTYNERGNDIKASARFAGDPELLRSGAFPDYLPYQFNRWGMLWNSWFTSLGEEGEEPPEEMKELYGLHERFMAAAPGSAEANDAMDGILANYRTNVWTIIPVEAAYRPTFFSMDVQGVPEGVAIDLLGIDVSRSMEQWFADA